LILLVSLTFGLIFGKILFNLGLICSFIFKKYRFLINKPII